MSETSRARHGRPGIVLMYHRIAEAELDPWTLCVTPRHFDEQLAVLRQHGRPVALDQVTATIEDERTPEWSIVVTLDDGYADSLVNAKPLLERHDVPATVFVTTGALGCTREFWWDELERLLLHPGVVPAVLRVRLDGETRTWELPEATCYDGAAFREHLTWRADQPADPTARHALYRSLYHRLKHVSADERAAAMDDLLRWTGGAAMARVTHRTLSPQEVVALGDGDLVDIGAHSMTHSNLPDLPVGAQRAEIEHSKARLENILGRPVTAFAYPHGSHASETVRLVREAGFACACSTDAGVIGHETDVFRLPRLMVGDWDGDEFGKHLASWSRT